MAFIIREAALSASIIAISSAFLLARSPFGLAAQPAFFADLAILQTMRAPFGFAVSGASLRMFWLSITFSLVEFLLAVFAVVTVVTQVRKNIKRNLRAIGPVRRMPRGF